MKNNKAYEKVRKEMMKANGASMLHGIDKAKAEFVIGRLREIRCEVDALCDIMEGPDYDSELSALLHKLEGLLCI